MNEEPKGQLAEEDGAKPDAGAETLIDLLAGLGPGWTLAPVGPYPCRAARREAFWGRRGRRTPFAGGHPVGGGHPA